MPETAGRDAAEGDDDTEEAVEIEPVERDVPLVLDVRRPYRVDGEAPTGAARRDYLGGLDWHPAWWRYIGDAVPPAIAEERRRWREWWTVPYVVARLREPRHLGVEAMDAILAWKAEGLHYWTVTERWRKGPEWLERQFRRGTRIVREWFLPYNVPPRPARLSSWRHERHVREMAARTTTT